MDPYGLCALCLQRRPASKHWCRSHPPCLWERKLHSQGALKQRTRFESHAKMDTQRINMELELGACGLLILLDALFFEEGHSDPNLKSQRIEL